jgi:hypothetical protein
VLSSVLIFALGAVQTFLDVGKLKERARKEQFLFLSILSVIVLVALVFGHWRQPAPYELYITWATSGLFLVSLLYMVVRLLTRPLALTTERAFGLAMVLIVMVSLAGSTFASVTKYSRGLHYDVFLKDREMADVKLVLFTSITSFFIAAT